MLNPKNIQTYDYIDHPYEQVRDLFLSEDARTIFSKATNNAADRAGTVAAELRVKVGGIEIGKDIQVEIHDVIDNPGDADSPPSTTIQFRWKAAQNPRLFPFMTAEIKILPFTEHETKLDFFGSYDPPLGKLGSGLDNVLGRRIAEASILRFMKDIAAFLKEELND